MKLAKKSSTNAEAKLIMLSLALELEVKSLVSQEN
jgi:hypothetical protein